MGEFALIDRIRARAGGRGDVVLGIGDDGAVLAVPAGRELVVAMDTLNAGVHFPPDTAPEAIGWKALAVNLSDLAAMGAQPAWCTLSLSLPDADAGWIDRFLDGFLELAAQFDVALVGGDTTRGPLSVSVTAHGFVEPGCALRRSGARPGDIVWVSGTLGDAAGALQHWRERRLHDSPLRDRLERPTPRVALGRALQGLATACIDVSDGLLADLVHVCRASGVGAEIDVDALPASSALADAFGPEARRALQAGGGDDYELCFTVPAAMDTAIRDRAGALGVGVTPIGIVAEATGVVARTSEGASWTPPRTGYAHFA